MKRFALIFLMLSLSAHAETIYFSCSGTARGSSIQYSYSKFDLRVETSPPNLTMPAYITACFPDENNIKKYKSSCEIDANKVSCSCTGGLITNSSTVSLSRISGNLTSIKVMKSQKDVIQGDYSCQKIDKKVF